MNALAQGFKDFKNDITILVWPILMLTTAIVIFACSG